MNNNVYIPKQQHSWWLRAPKPNVVFDFDGVIHSYRRGWKGDAEIPDAPVPGIRESIAHIRLAGYRVVVVSTRCRTPDGLEAVQAYLNENEIEVDDVRTDKIPVICYIDDRAICFDGHPETLLEKIINFEPWNSTKKQED